jgi:uncharacterized membrane protein (TIGR02234 family)
VTSARRLFAVALLLDVVGAGAALLISTRPWQTITVARPRPLADITEQLSGRSLDPALLGATLVALAGVVAVLATKGIARRIVGVLLALSGVLLGWRALTNADRISHSRAIDIVTSRRGNVGISPQSATHIDLHSSWPVLTVVAAVLVVLAGGLVAVFGGRWSAMSARYEAPSAKPVVGDEAMWSALDRGDDPTTRTD